ncbi:hypothetical protein [Streptomyces millisiae]|uniref:Uncharacterized protein n=1 Tax=Streptomyces millisiae TaxID=3075542 RepID=A0ABU2LXP6_9ACTN|nr:hypothetical protein [Streptomyces sp. DSM 44918]MDT0322373.1 hypothetical protein [Streptomyces sp. DSM 44918]
MLAAYERDPAALRVELLLGVGASNCRRCATATSADTSSQGSGPPR